MLARTCGVACWTVPNGLEQSEKQANDVELPSHKQPLPSGHCEASLQVGIARREP